MATQSGRNAVAYWLKKDPLSFNLHGVFGSTRKIFDSYDYFVAESARVEELRRTGASEDVQRAVRKRLASRLNVASIIMCLFAMGWLMLGEYLQIWQTYGLNYGRAVFASISVALPIVIAASLFPSDLSRTGGRTFVLPASIVTVGRQRHLGHFLRQSRPPLGHVRRDVSALPASRPNRRDVHHLGPMPRCAPTIASTRGPSSAPSCSATASITYWLRASSDLSCLSATFCNRYRSKFAIRR